MEVNDKRDYHKVDKNGHILETKVATDTSQVPSGYHMGWSMDQVFIEPVWRDGEWKENKTDDEVASLLLSRDNIKAKNDLEKPVSVAAFNNIKIAVRKILKQVDMTNEELLELIEVYPKWSEVEDNTPLGVGDYYQHNGKLYVIPMGKGHNKQSNWAPDTAHSEFEEVLPEGVIPMWIKGEGYSKGAKVTHINYVWTSKHLGNVAEPGQDEAGGYRFWTKGEYIGEGEEPLEFPKDSEIIKDWVKGKTYGLGDKVKYGDVIYESIHPNNTWEPPEWSVWKEL